MNLVTIGNFQTTDAIGVDGVYFRLKLLVFVTQSSWAHRFRSVKLNKSMTANLESTRRQMTDLFLLPDIVPCQEPVG